MEKKAWMDIKPKKGRKEKEKEVKENPNTLVCIEISLTLKFFPPLNFG